MRTFFFLIAVLIMLTIGTLQAATALANPLPGAIFTTLPDGSVVNENHYENKCDVALNGGPQGQSSHHLPDGTYDVAVTDPSGKTVLGVGEGRVTIANGAGTFGPTSLCVLLTPSPYDSTSNPGGVYKAWLCVSGQLFVHHDCKTDNFKVEEIEKQPVVIEPTPTPPPTALVPPADEEPTPAPTPEPRMPIQFPDSGGEPPSEGSSTMGYVILGSLGMALPFGLVILRRLLLGFF